MSTNQPGDGGRAQSGEAAMTTYARARADFEALEEIAELDDQMELDAEREPLMRNPTKKYAAELYCSAIDLWFREHGITEETAEIARRHNIKS